MRTRGLQEGVTCPEPRGWKGRVRLESWLAGSRPSSLLAGPWISQGEKHVDLDIISAWASCSACNGWGLPGEGPEKGEQARCCMAWKRGPGCVCGGGGGGAGATLKEGSRESPSVCSRWQTLMMKTGLLSPWPLAASQS